MKFRVKHTVLAEVIVEVDADTPENACLKCRAGLIEQEVSCKSLGGVYESGFIIVDEQGNLFNFDAWLRKVE